MIKRVKGLSTVVSTLLIILLVFIAVGVLWSVVSNFVNEGSQSVDLDSACLDITVTPTNIVDLGDDVYNVTIFRSGGTDEIGGVKLIFYSESDSFQYDVSGNIAALGVKTVTVPVDIPNSETLRAIIYFTSSSGKNESCRNYVQVDL